jgi:hypothetical protein
MSVPSLGWSLRCADSHAAALITRAEPTRTTKKRLERVLDDPSGAENVYGNQNCNEVTVAQRPPSAVQTRKPGPRRRRRNIDDDCYLRVADL